MPSFFDRLQIEWLHLFCFCSSFPFPPSRARHSIAPARRRRAIFIATFGFALSALKLE
jgi:hypothetical protein